MILTKSFKVLSVDMSYRDTGYSLISKHGSSICIEFANNIKNPPMQYGFEGMRIVSSKMKRNTAFKIQEIINTTSPDVILVEMPSLTQDAKSALAIGVCWGIVQSFKCILIEPSFLKLWSDSKRGDKKEKVKQKVLARTRLDSYQQSNDNIVDAVGIGLAFIDLVEQQ